MTTRSKIHLSILALGAALLVSFKVSADTELSGSGEFWNIDDEVTINFDIDHRQEYGDGWQYVFESDYYLSKQDGVANEYSIYSQFKLNKDIDDKSYVLSVLQVDYDKFRDYDIRSVLGFGYGRKLYRSDKLRISNETSLAYLDANGTEFIVRNSLWVAYMLTDNISITNKALYESSKELYVRIETELKYRVNDRFSVSISNDHTENYRGLNDLLTFNFEITL